MKNSILLFLFIVAFWSCGGKSESGTHADFYSEDAKVESAEPELLESMEEMQVANEAVFETKTKKAAISNKKESGNNLQNPLNYLADTLYLQNVRLSKKFIKTADLRFKVENVQQSTNNIERLALKIGGYIQQSQIRSNYVSSKSIEVSPDTVMDVLEYYVDNNMVIRVPSIYFDSVLAEISKEHIYLDRREVKTEDVSTVFLRNKLKEEKRTEYEKRIQKAVDKAPRKLDDIVMAERQASELADIAIDKKIDNYKLQDRIDFSTIVMNLYQANDIHKELVENTRLSEYQPNFWQKAWKALRTGWKAILEIIIGLLYVWPLYIVAIGVYYLIKYLRKRMK